MNKQELKQKIVDRILQLPGVGSAEHAIMFGIETEDIEEAADSIIDLIDDYDKLDE